MKSDVQKSERSYVWKEMQQWLKSIQPEDTKLKPIGSPIFLIYHSKIQEYDSSHHKQTMLCPRFSNNIYPTEIGWRQIENLAIRPNIIKVNDRIINERDDKITPSIRIQGTS